MYSEHNQNASQMPVTSPEAAERQELVGQVVQESLGTVGIHTAAALTPEEKAQVANTINARADQASQEGRPVYPVDRSRSAIFDKTWDGFGEYGEAPTLDNVSGGDPGWYDKHPETAVFMPLQGGNVAVTYGFSGRAYTGGYGRISDVLRMSFVASPDIAGELRSAVETDPGIMYDIAKNQALALGFTLGYWNQKMAPRLQHFVTLDQEKPEGLENHSLSIVDYQAAYRSGVDPHQAVREVAYTQTPDEKNLRIRSERLLQDTGDPEEVLDDLAGEYYFQGIQTLETFNPDRARAAEIVYTDFLNRLYPTLEAKKALYGQQYGSWILEHQAARKEGRVNTEPQHSLENEFGLPGSQFENRLLQLTKLRLTHDAIELQAFEQKHGR
jgi:hypothetical protein